MAFPGAGKGAAVLALAAIIFACHAEAAETPQISVQKKYVEISVQVDPAAKPFAALFANCLAEGKAWADKMDGTAAAEWRDIPSSFRGL
jgi:hypothetical protein